MEVLQALDLKVLYFVNHTLSNSFFDWLMPLMRHKLTWIPLYLVIIYLIIRRYGWKSIWVLLFAVLAVVVSDQISSGLIKPFFERVRPSNNPNLAAWLNLPNGHGNGWSFVSSHASNHFALSVYLIHVFLRYSYQYKVILPLLCWAALVSFAQVYIGFHYPSDVVVGGLLGIAIGHAFGKLNCLVLCMRSGDKI